MRRLGLEPRLLLMGCLMCCRFLGLPIACRTRGMVVPTSQDLRGLKEMCTLVMVSSQEALNSCYLLNVTQGLLLSPGLWLEIRAE